MDIKNKAIRVFDKKVYFFNEEGIYIFLSIKEARNAGIKGIMFNGKTGEHYQDFDREVLVVGYYDEEKKRPRYVEEYGKKSYALKRAILCLEIGDSIEKFYNDVKRFEKIYERPFSVCNTVFRVSNGNFYFFDSNGKYTFMKEKEIVRSDIFIGFVQLDSRSKKAWYKCDIELRKLGRKYDCDNEVIERKAITQMKIGDTEETFGELVRNTKLEKRDLPQGIDRFITRVRKPDFFCTPENPNKDTTFDYIHIYVGTVVEWENKMQYIKSHLSEIESKVLDKIEKDRTFKKFGVPVNVLKLSEVTMRNRTSELKFVFELKSI